MNEKSLKKADDIKKQLKNYLLKIDKNAMEKEEELKVAKLEEMLTRIEDKSYNITLEASKKEELIIKCLLTGYFTNIARYSSDNYFTTIRDKNLCKIHPTSILIKNPKLGRSMEYLIYNDIIVTNKQYLKCNTLIRQDIIKKYLNNSNILV